MIAKNGLGLSFAPAAGETLLARWRRRARQRGLFVRLLETSPHLIDDLGLDRRDVVEEAQKPFWRA